MLTVSPTPFLVTLVQFYFDPYDWSFPPDLIIHGLLLSPSLADLGLDESWDHEDPRNLSKVLGKLSRMMQVRTLLCKVTGISHW